MRNLNPTTCLEVMPTCEALNAASPAASCEKNHETLRALASAHKNCRGSVSMYSAERGIIEGEIYSVNGVDYVVDVAGRLHRYAEGQAIEKTELDMVKAIVRDQMTEDFEIEKARNELAKLESGGDRILESVMSMHLWYTGGTIIDSPETKDGIKFYQVGRNASHDFYCGVKDGQRYIAAYGPDYDPEKSEESQDFEHVADVYPVDTFAGHYLGHC